MNDAVAVLKTALSDRLTELAVWRYAGSPVGDRRV